MHKRFFIFLLLFFNFGYGLEINIKPEQFEKMKLLIGLIKPDMSLCKIGQKLKADFEFSDQFNVDIQKIDEINKKNDIAKLEKLGYPIIIFLNSTLKNGKYGVQWRLYDSSQASMLKGKQIFCENENIAHVIADQIWPELTDQKTSFCSAIAACKQINNKKKKYSHLYVMHPMERSDGLTESVCVVNEPTVCLAPRWHNKKPLLYYSKHTSLNVRLMAIDTNKKNSVVTNFDGLNLTPSISDDKKIILCIAIKDKGRICQYKFDHKHSKGHFVPLTDKNVHAISPSFIDNDNIVFCSIDKTNKSRITTLNLTSNEIKYLTNKNEYSTSPSYCKINNCLVYCKKIDGCMQIFLNNLITNEHEQITLDKGDKDSCSWSPCGNFITYCVEQTNKGRIAVMNMQSKKTKFLTPKGENWNSPNWSPNYDQIPFM